MRKQQRFYSHILVDIQTSPLFFWKKTNAILNDLSLQGFCIQLVEEDQKLKANQSITLYLYVSHEKYKFTGTIRWYDPQQKKAGGVFSSPLSQETFDKMMNHFLTR